MQTEKERSFSKNAPIAVVGLGYVGLPLARLAQRKGYHVTGVDVDTAKVATLMHSEHFETTTDYTRIARASVVIICVPTPVHEDHSPDFGPLENASRSVGRNLKKGALVIIESTVNPGACESIVLPILEKESGMRAGSGFLFAHCPERINPGDDRWHVENISRVLGGYDTASTDKARMFYMSVLDADVRVMSSLKEAEAVKIVENAFRDINIAFVNELARLFTRLGIDILNVIQGASTKPFGFLPHYPGCGVGGHCIPVDPYYLIAYGEKNGFHPVFLSQARKINSGMPAYTVDLAETALKECGKQFAGSAIAVLGLSYKAEIGDDRESPSYVICQELQRRGARVLSYDPFLPDQSSAHSLDEALRGAPVAIVATAHRMFLSLKPAYVRACGIAAVIDGRNCLRKEEFMDAGILYKGIGR